MLNGQFPNNNMMMNNSNNQNNNNDFPDQSHIAQQFNQRNNMNQNMMMNNNMNNNMNMMNNMGNNMNMMNNNMGKMNNNMGMMNNNMGMNNMNNMGMMNNNMGKGNMNNNMGIMNNMNNMGMMNNNNMNMMNNMGMINNIRKMNTMNNIGMNNNMSKMNTMNNMQMMNNNMGMNNNFRKMNTMNNMQMMNNNMGMNNMALVRRNTNTFNINWFNNNYLPNNMNSQNYIFIMNMLHNQMLQRQYYQMMFQRRMFYQMQKNILERRRKMNEILDMNFNNNNQNQNQQIFKVQVENEEDDYVPNQALLDVIQEPNPPNQNQNNQNQNQNNPILPSELVSEVIVDVMNLNPDLLSGLGNNLLGEWAQGENRGGRPYKPPNGWIGYGLNVLNKYDNGNNDWLACNGRQGEWCIAFHGACNGQSSDNVKKGIKAILETNLRPGGGQAYKDHADANHPGQKVGVGVYCSPEPSVIDGYSGIMNINGHNYKAAFMLRVKPDRIRYSSSRQDYWVVNGDFSELRPYRLLIKPC